MQFIQESLRKYPFKKVIINPKRYIMETKIQFEILKIETDTLAELIRVDNGQIDSIGGNKFM
jgi:hypothetical protein